MGVYIVFLLFRLVELSGKIDWYKQENWRLANNANYYLLRTRYYENEVNRLLLQLDRVDKSEDTRFFKEKKKELTYLCHPDKHNNSVLSTKVFEWLQSIK